MFGKGSLIQNSNKTTHSSFPVSLFCENVKDEGFKGDIVKGMTLKFCNQFYQTPTDVGFCMTKNTNVKALVKMDNMNDYNEFMEMDKRNFMSLPLDGTYSAESTDILMTSVFDNDEQEPFLRVSICSS